MCTCTVLAAVIVLLMLLLIGGAWFIGRGFNKVVGQAAIYAMAAHCAGRTGKPLVVVGAPGAPRTLNAYFGCGHGCGDLCVDIAGAPGCPAAIKMPIQEWLARQPDNSAVIFESEVLGYIPDAELEPTIAELERVSGGDLFASHSNSINLPKYVATGAKQPVNVFNTQRMKLVKPRPGACSQSSRLSGNTGGSRCERRAGRPPFRRPLYRGRQRRAQ